MEIFRDSEATPPVKPNVEFVKPGICRTESNLLDLAEGLEKWGVNFDYIDENLPLEELVNRCQVLCDRFRQLGAIADVDEAIRLLIQARRRAPSHEDQLLPQVLLQCGIAYTLRYTALGEEEDFGNAQRILGTISEQSICSSAQAACFRTLAQLYEGKYNEDLKPKSLDQAITYARRAAALIANEGRLQDSQTSVSELAWFLCARYEARKDVQDLDEVVRLHTQVISLSQTFEQRHVILWRYGRSLRLRYELVRTSNDFFDAEEALTAALTEADARQSQRLAMIAWELADLYAARHKTTLEPPDLMDALRFYTVAAEATASPAKDKLRAVIRGAKLAMRNEYIESAFRMYGTAISILPQLAWVGLETRRRYAKLKRLTTHLSCDAAAVALSIGRPEVAVEILNHGRAVVWRTVLDIRTDLTPLQDVAPLLYEEMKKLGEQLDSEMYDIHTIPPEAQEAFNQHRRRAAERWEELLQDARKIPAFATFLKPQSYSEIQQGALEGPVIFLNISEYRSDALIVTLDEGVNVVRLEGLGLQSCRQLAFSFEKALRVAKDKEGCRYLEETLRTVLQRLWHGGIDSVARTLYQLRCSSGTRQRVWWVPTDALSILPIHAAGPYENGAPGLPELFISSYTTTLTALINARRALSHAMASPITPGLVAISQPNVPGLPVLSTAPLEIDAVKKYAPFKSISVANNGLEDLWNCAVDLPTETFWLHCCAHGHWDPLSPMDSSIRFHDGRLTLAHIIHLDFTSTTEFAFLSACHTARHSIVAPDEAMHLAAGLQIAGLKAVVATGWAMVDSDGPRLAYWFYTHLRKLSPEPRVTDTAAALAGAVDELRKLGAPMYRWAVFVHHGV
ncbi:hypothetical protein CALVIDRAFT_172375 [Calocera viscosa TUFC12733]|uniref:CHAT domain-containing protein n=1 Tax=Calocera viscosa (strain TUFC12733) TaxID=1330018 RepID=A0A167KX41_CALVF|nr:hypothetical protein CALVIDRAFT_172375 [Calocera viscosa TUFC12733]